MSSTLLLNADYTPMELSPISLLSWRESIRAYYTNSISILKTYDHWRVRSPSIEFEVPSIVVSNHYHKRNNYAKLTRKNLFVRDEYRCQYCGVKFYYHELTFDHVLPRSHGGDSSWENMVACCKSCNHKKGNNPKILPIKRPHRPTWHEIYNQSKCYRITIPDPAWQEFLQWPEELLEIKILHN